MKSLIFRRNTHNFVYEADLHNVTRLAGVSTEKHIEGENTQ